MSRFWGPLYNTKIIASQDTTNVESEVITPVAVADSLDDYRPCRPQDFVGRYQVQQKIWSFLKRVRDEKTSTRIIAFSGPSGFGKSSIILKLADRFRNQKWANKFYLYPVDVRSARGPLFVAKALKEAIQTAIADGFITPPSQEITIESTENFLQSRTVQSALEELQSNKRVLVVFFDQFEELFTKDELLSTFDIFKRLAFEAHSLGANIVIGFSWRTGITLSDDNPAYHVWHELKDYRVDIQLGEFTSAESSQLVTQFEKGLNEKLLPPLRRRLLEQGQGLPWLLKKLCIHIYREIQNKTSQDELLSRRLNAKSLFNEDLETLTDIEGQCLRYIAAHSPADTIEIFDHFDSDVVNRLYNARLIIRAGQKYAVYWDIFRDYLNEGIVPAIPLTYVPVVELPMTIRAIRCLQENPTLDLTQIAKKLGYAESTTQNIVGDLQNLLITSRNKNGEYSLRQEFMKADLKRVAEFVRGQMQEHILIQLTYKSLEPGQSMTLEQFKETIAKAYSLTTLKPGTINAYLNRLLPWFCFVGLLDSLRDKVIRPQGKIGQDFGRLELIDSPKRRSRKRVHLGLMCSSSPEQVLRLAEVLAQNGKIDKHEISKNHYRNTAVDLSALELAIGEGGDLFPTKALNEAVQSNNLHQVVRERSLKSKFLKELQELLDTKSTLSNAEMGQILSVKMGREWSEASSIRYAGAGKRWLNFFNSSQVDIQWSER